MEEVLMLDERNGGGNRIAMETQLGRVPKDARPPPGSIDAIKQFVDRAYNQNAWKVPLQNSGTSTRTSAPSPGENLGGDGGQSNRLGSSRSMDGSTSGDKAPPQAIKTPGNLLDDMFETVSVSVPTTTTAPKSGGPVGSLLDDLLFSPQPQCSASNFKDASKNDFALPDTCAINPTGGTNQVFESFACAQNGTKLGSGTTQVDFFDPFATNVQKPAMQYPVQSVGVTRGGTLGCVPQPTALAAPAPCMQSGGVNFSGSVANPAGNFDPFAAATPIQFTQPVPTTAPQVLPLHPNSMQPQLSTVPTQWPAPSGATGMPMATGKNSAFTFVNAAPQPSMPSQPAQMSMQGPLPLLAQPPPDPLASVAPQDAAQMFDPFAPVKTSMQSAATPMCVRA